MNVPAYGGNLFDPIRHPFLEGVGVDGEVFDVGVVDDATTRHVLELLQRLDGQRLSYRAFSVEQIGQVYESLLDHSAVSVPDDTVVLGLVGTKGGESPRSSSPTSRNSTPKASSPTGWPRTTTRPAARARWRSGRAASTAPRTSESPPRSPRRATATTRCSPGSRSSPGCSAPTPAASRSCSCPATSTSPRHATAATPARPTPARSSPPRSPTTPSSTWSTSPGPHNEEDESKWQIKRPEEILELRVCDPAVGSGAILVAAVRYLADKLVESRLEHGELTARDLETAAADPMATDPHVQARRDVVSQCIYAVDRDPMAVEMAKLSLWLITMAHGRPFTFLDHAIKCGDSLLGVTSLDQLRRLHLDESAGTQIGLDLDGGRVEGLGELLQDDRRAYHKAIALR